MKLDPDSLGAITPKIPDQWWMRETKDMPESGA
jgi:hypothetical protein